MHKQQIILICIKSFTDSGKMFHCNTEYMYYKGSYTCTFYNIYNLRRDLISTIIYDDFKDNFIEKSVINTIDNQFNKLMDVL